MFPNLRMVVCGTGMLPILQAWWVELLCRPFPDPTITGIDQHAPTSLGRISDALGFERRKPMETSTIYHFGYDPAADAMRGIAYRSERDFASEPLDYGFGFKPGDGVDEAFEASVQTLIASARTPADFAAFFVAVITAQKAVQDAKLPEERLYIGNEIHLLNLESHSLHLKIILRFDDAPGEAGEQAPAAPGTN
jgi:hypothetical protein